MDPVKNPYRPGAGTKPLILAGRDEVVTKASVLLKRTKIGNPERSLMLYGLRGVGKTVLLNEFEKIANQEDFIVEHLEISESDDFKFVVARTFRKLLLKISTLERAKAKGLRALRVLKAFTISIPDGPELKIDVDAIAGEADSGNLQSDLVDLMKSLGLAAQEEGKTICILIDEAQYLKENAYASFIAASHRVVQLQLPIVVICAGLPQIAALSGEAKSYAERLFEFVSVENLKDKEAIFAITEPARTLNVTFSDDAVQEMLKVTQGYPYFIQEFGKNVWDLATNGYITKNDVELAKAKTFIALDESFFKVRLDRATSAEKNLMKAMASLGSGPYRINDVAQSVKRKVESISPIRATLISKGFVYSPQHGHVAFTVPQFDSFLRRFFQIRIQG